MLEAKIAELGFQGVTAKVDSVQFVSASDKATVGVSAADDDTNGDITFFDMDPNEYSGYNFNGLRTATVSFTLSKDGETAAYAPGSILIPWNEDMLQQRLDNVAQQLTIGYSDATTPTPLPARSRFRIVPAPQTSTRLHGKAPATR